MKKILLAIGCSVMLFASCGNSSTQEVTGACCSTPKDSLVIIMNIPIKIKPEYVSAYKKAFEKCQAGSLQEDACLDYYIYQSYTDSTEFHLFERWTNKPGHLNHMQTEHFKQYKEDTKGMSDQARTKSIVTYVCPCVN